MAVMFEWDESNTNHLSRHDVTREEAESVFAHPMYEEPGKSVAGEERIWALGVTDEGRCLTVVYTSRGDAIRVITAHTAKRKYRSFYAKTIDSQSSN